MLRFRYSVYCCHRLVNYCTLLFFSLEIPILVPMPDVDTFIRIGEFVSVVYNTQRNNAKRRRLHVLSFERCLKIIMCILLRCKELRIIYNTIIINRTSHAFTVENTKKRARTHNCISLKTMSGLHKKKKLKQIVQLYDLRSDDSRPKTNEFFPRCIRQQTII